MTAETETKTVAVSKIKEGTVIDHIPPGKGLTILQVLNSAATGKQMTLGSHLKSASKGVKDIIKIEHYGLSQEELHKIAVIAPDATINVIADYRVEKKYRVEIPSSVTGLFTCPNPLCITNHETMKTVFNVKKMRKEIHLQCRYCTKSF